MCVEITHSLTLVCRQCDDPEILFAIRSWPLGQQKTQTEEKFPIMDRYAIVEQRTSDGARKPVFWIKLSPSLTNLRISSEENPESGTGQEFEGNTP